MSLAEVDLPQAAVPARSLRAAHVDPPTSPSRLLCDPVSRLIAVALVFLALAITAFIDGGRTLLEVDAPIERFVVENRTSWLDVVFRRISFFGSTVTVLTGGLLLAIIAWRRCRLVTGLIVVATLSRPLVEFTLKELVGRERPNLSQLLDGVGHSFPSGHPMAAATLWLMIPLVVSLYTSSRRAWWTATIVAVSAVVLIGLSRIYLGVHWASDVVGGFLAASVLVAALDVAYVAVHARRHCTGSQVTRPAASKR